MSAPRWPLVVLAALALAYTGAYLAFRATHVFNGSRSGRDDIPLIRIDLRHGHFVHYTFRPAFWIDHRFTGVALYLDDGHSQDFEVPGEE